ncbi:MAG: tRNA (N(6)-L-threonylcarbamoyladenosine(37)-C(2))-methylthiotransferase MtaB [Bacilli bacterium]|nr:tRNA (N(6)-L-threonylcarbamoyladenosine(37)-C(2))-methylthiotransferase MtaB [Bacilli bacterium]
MKFAIYTLGCKVNTYESEFMTHLFKSKGYKQVDYKDKADIYIINTCTVTNTSDNKSKKIINHTRELNPNSIIIVCGCFTQYMKGDISNKDKVDIIIGNKDKSKIVDLLEDYLKEKNKVTKIYDLKKQNFEDMEIKKFESHTRAFVKIQDGCNNFCSYCIIPYVRGNVRSKKLESVIKEVNNLVKNGHREVVLTGIHTGHYGSDINSNLTKLLKELSKIDELKRIRISSIEITELTDEFLNELENNKLIVDHMHIPLQSGTDKTLKAMNRKYDTKYFYEKICKIREIRPDISITTDVIVGFPDETDADFNKTVEFIKKVNFSKLHVFPYSKRNGTVAASMKNQIDGKIKKDRAHTLLELSKKLENDYYNKFINSDVEVLIERCKDNKYIGHTSNYLEVEIESNKDITNQLYMVHINEIIDNKCIGKLKEGGKINEKNNDNFSCLC